jgi:hypothetical protein
MKLLKLIGIFILSVIIATNFMIFLKFGENEPMYICVYKALMITIFNGMLAMMIHAIFDDL